jgi:hypothetical protein
MRLFLTFAILLLLAPLAHADKLVLVAGTGKPTGEASGKPAVEAALNVPFGVDFDRAGNMFVVEMVGQRVHKIDSKGILTTIGGTGAKGGDGDNGPASGATFNGMHNLAVAPTGEIYLADTWNNRIRKIDPKTGVISGVAGTGKKGYSGDGGPALEAQFGGIYCATLDPAGEKLYLADLDNRRIRAVDLKSGKVSLVAGNGEKGVPKDGAVAAESPLVDPRAVTADKQGNVYILERGGHALRIVDPAGKIRTVVGTGKNGATGDGGPALEATMAGPKHLCLDHDGSVILADTDNHLIRRYLPAEGKIVRIAGTGKKGTGGVDGDPLAAQFNQPHGVYVHADGTLYITDSHNNRVLKIVK